MGSSFRKKPRNNARIPSILEGLKRYIDDLPQLLLQAVRDSNLEETRTLIRHGANPNARDADGNTPLIHAAHLAQTTIVELLIHNGADVNICNCHGMSPLHMACLLGKRDLIELLLNNGADINIQPLKDSDPPLVFALNFAWNTGKADIIKLLLEKGADVHKKTKEGTPIIEWARANVSQEISTLLSLPKQVPMSSKPPMMNGQTGDAFVDSCFHFDIIERNEDRDWSKIPEATELAKKGNTAEVSGLQEAIRLGEELKSKYPDFDFCYCWLGHLYLQLNSYGEAHKAVSDGFRLAKSKYGLCEHKAMIHLKVGELEEAVRWWIRALVIRVRSRKLNDVQTLIYLSYVAEALNLDIECRLLRKAVDWIRDGIRLAPSAANNLYELTHAWGSPSMKQAITLLVKQYISAEFDRRSEELRKVAPRGIYCEYCNTRFSAEQLRWYGIEENRWVFYECPKCRINRDYDSQKDTGP